MHGRIVRAGHVVEAPAGKVVRFPAPADGCPAAGGCRCGARAVPDLALGPLGLTPVEGQRLEVSVAARGLSAVSLALFGLPLAMLVLGALAGSAAAGRLGWPVEVSAATGGLAALFLAWWVVLRRGGTLLRLLRLDVRADRAADGAE